MPKPALDNADIEQKNWTYVRKRLGCVRYDSPAVQAAIDTLCLHEVGLFLLFRPRVKHPAMPTAPSCGAGG